MTDPGKAQVGDVEGYHHHLSAPLNVDDEIKRLGRMSLDLNKESRGGQGPHSQEDRIVVLFSSLYVSAQ